MIKPEFFDDPDVGELSPLARLLFIGLWILADKEGRLQDDPRRIKARVFPYDNIDISALTSELHAKDMIRRYSAEAGQDRFIWIKNFTRHQRPHPKEKESDIPPCDSETGKFNGATLRSREKDMLSKPDPNSGSLILDPDPNSGIRNLGSTTSNGKKPPSDVPEAIDYYFKGYQARFHEKPNINGSKDGSLLKKLLKAHGKSAVFQRIDNMFHSRDAFIQNSGCTIGVLSSQWNKLRSTESATGKTAGTMQALERFARRRSV